MLVNILGFGVMGRQLSAALQVLGHDVRAWNRTIHDGIHDKHATMLRLSKRRLSVDRDAGSLELTDDLASIAPGLTIECLAENLDVKRDVIARLPFDPGSVEFYSNTSSFRPADIAAAVIGLHFFNPVHTVRLIEVAGPKERVGPAGVALLGDFAGAGFTIVHTKDNPGYVGNFVLFSEIAAALKLVDRFGYTSKTIDQVQAQLGRQTSIFDVIDFVGVDVTRDILAILAKDDPGFGVPAVIERALSAGIMGQKNRTSIRSVVDRAESA